jgi:hypothetical protein
VKLRALTVLAVFAGAAGALVWWRRRRGGSPDSAAVQLGLVDGSTQALEVGDPAAAEIVALGATLRTAFEAQA